MAEDEGADRSRDKANEINAEGVECRGQWVFVRKKQLAEHQASHRAVQEKIVPLDRGSYGCGDNGATEFSTMLVWCKRIVRVGHGYHLCFLPESAITPD